MARARASFVGALDQGTTSTRFVVYETTAPRDARTYAKIASAQREHAQRYPSAGVVRARRGGDLSRAR